MKSIVVRSALVMLLLGFFFMASGTLSGAADAPDKKPAKAVEKFDGKPMVFTQWGFQILVPRENWQITETNDEAIPLELTHGKGALIQLMMFPKTMTTLEEAFVSLNRRFENNFCRDGVKDYKISFNKEYRTPSHTGRRVKAVFTSGKGTFIVDQVYLEGQERIFVLVMTGTNKVHAAALKDFEGMALSLSPVTEKDSPGEKETKDQEKGNGQHSGKGSDR